MAKMQRSGRLPCKKNMTLFLSTTLGPWCHSPRVENPFLANGCSKSNMGSMVKSNGTRRGLWQEVSPKHLELDYNETFAPVAKFVSIRCILALAAIEDMEIHQMDVKTAFLNGDLEKEIHHRVCIHDGRWSHFVE